MTTRLLDSGLLANTQEAFDFIISILEASTEYSIIDVLYNASVYRDEKGNVLGVFAAARDVPNLNATSNRCNRPTARIANSWRTCRTNFARR